MNYKKTKILSISALLTILLLVPMISVALAKPNGGSGASSTPVRLFSATINPTTATPGQTQSYIVTITSDISSNRELGSATIAIPTGFTSITSLSINNANWQVSLDSVNNLIKLKTDDDPSKLSGGQSVQVTFTATAPIPTETTPYTWTTSAWMQSNYGGDAFTLSGNQPVVTVVVSTAELMIGKWRTYLESEIYNCNNDCKVSYNSNYENPPKDGYEFEVEIECEALADEEVSIYINGVKLADLTLDEDGKAEETYYIAVQLFDNAVVTIKYDGNVVMTSGTWVKLW
jgi:hypothetical protein